MIQDLRIVHRLKPHTFSSQEGLPIWATCLRSLAIVNPHFAAETTDEVFQGENAYRFLLEVICGLKSPIVGETEVFGQFKTFTQEWLKVEPKWASLVQRLLSDAKAIRSEHLLNLGVQSYGSWVRSQLKPQRVHIVGGGQLASEIYPYLAKQQRSVTVHVRDIGKGFVAPKRLLRDKEFDGGALVIAAPLSAAEIKTWLGGKIPEQVIDLRETSSSDSLGFTGHVLSDIFSEIEKTKALLQPRLEQIRREIRERSAAAGTQSLLRPQGWDDLCA